MKRDWTVLFISYSVQPFQPCLVYISSALELFSVYLELTIKNQERVDYDNINFWNFLLDGMLYKAMQLFYVFFMFDASVQPGSIELHHVTDAVKDASNLFADIIPFICLLVYLYTYSIQIFT